MEVDKKILLKLLIYISIGSVLLFWVYQVQNGQYQIECLAAGKQIGDCSLWDKVMSDLKNANVEWFFIIGGIFAFSNVLRALNWQNLLRSMNYEIHFLNAFFCISASYFINLLIPRMGEVSRATLLAKYEKVPFDKAFGTIVLERVVDVLMLLGMVIISAPIFWNLLGNFVESGVENIVTKIGEYWILFALIFALAGLFLLWLIKSNSDHILLIKIRALISGILEGLLSIFNMKKPYIYLLYSLGVWICYYLMNYFGFRILDETSHLPPSAAVVVFIFSAFAIALPSPGGAGSFQYFNSIALMLFSIKKEVAFSQSWLAFIFVSYAVNIFIGIVSLIGLHYFKKIREAK